MAHTPGPWRIFDTKVRKIRTVGVGPAECVSASHCLAEINRLWPDWEGNAALIARSPQLLAVLARLAPFLASKEDMLNDAAMNEGRASEWTSASYAALSLLAELRPRVEQLDEPEPRHDHDAPSINERAQRSYYDKYYGS